MEDESRREDEGDGLSALVRRILPHSRSAEEQLERLVVERLRELDERAARFEETVVDLERREQLLRDSRASVERLLRLGTSDLDARETELAALIRDLTERELRIREEEDRLAQRRGELGAVELKRAAVEARESALESRESALESRESTLESREKAIAVREAELERRAPDTRLEPAEDSEAPRPLVFFVPGPTYRLLQIEHASAAKGAAVEVEGTEYLVLRTGPSPLPNDPRTCVYLVRGASRSSRFTGSS